MHMHMDHLEGFELAVPIAAIRKYQKMFCQGKPLGGSYMYRLKFAKHTWSWPHASQLETFG